MPESEGRSGFATVALNDSIYIFGGVGDTTCDKMMDKVYRLDTKTQTWNIAGKIPESRSNLVAVTWNNSILVLGGCNSGYDPTKTSWVYTPGSNQWLKGVEMPTPRCLFAAATIKDTVYVIGGYSYDPQSSAMASVDAYSASTHKWTSMAPMNRARYGHGAVEYGGKIYVAGGAHNSTIVREIEVYDPISNKWSFLTAMIKPRMSVALAIVQSSIFILGGTSDWRGTSLTDVEVYHIEKNLDEKAEEMEGARYGLGAATVGKTVYAIGGIHTISISDTKTALDSYDITICDSMVEKYTVVS